MLKFKYYLIKKFSFFFTKKKNTVNNIILFGQNAGKTKAILLKIKIFGDLRLQYLLF